MKAYEEVIKCKNSLPNKITLHDAVITGCKLKESRLTLRFNGGFMFIQSSRTAPEEWAESGNVVFEDIDPDFCEFSILGNKKYRSYKLDQLCKLLKKDSVRRFEIVDEYYGYSSALFCGYFWYKSKHKQFQIKLHYYGNMIYKYERER